MRTWGEVTALVRAAARLWWRFLPQLLLWFWVGYAVNRLSLQTAAGFGASAKVSANIAFGMALIATAGATILRSTPSGRDCASSAGGCSAFGRRRRTAPVSGRPTRRSPPTSPRGAPGSTRSR